MSYYDEEFYGAPSEFDMQVEEFKSMLSNAVRDQFKAEMERLQKENQELQEVKRNWESIQREYSAKYRQLDLDRQNMERQVRRERLDFRYQRDYSFIRVDRNFEQPFITDPDVIKEVCILGLKVYTQSGADVYSISIQRRGDSENGDEYKITYYVVEDRELYVAKDDEWGR